MDLIVVNNSTGESKSFAPTEAGYAQADSLRQRIEASGAGVSDGGSGSLKRIGDYFANVNNCGRSGSPKFWN